MMHVGGLVLFLSFLPSGARRSIRIDDSHHDEQQQNKTLADGLDVSAEGWQEFHPGGSGTRVFRRVGPHAVSLREGSKPHLMEPHRTAPWFRFGTRRAKVALQAASRPEEDQLALDRAVSTIGVEPSPAGFVPFATRGRASAPVMVAVDTLIVTDGTDSFYGSQNVLLYLHMTGLFASITAFSSSARNAKKALLTRELSSSGLFQKLHVAEGGAAELAKAFGEATVWVAVNADEHNILEQVAAAGRSGVKRAFIHLVASGTPMVDTDALTKALIVSGMEYTLMRTGELVNGGTGSELILSDIDLPSCDELPREDVFRFLAEALTLEAAVGRAFSLCVAANNSQLQEMRRAGLSHREMVEASLQGKIEDDPERTRDPVEDAAEAARNKQQEEEEEEDRTEEYRRLFAQAEERKRRYKEEKAKEEEYWKTLREKYAEKYPLPTPRPTRPPMDDGTDDTDDTDDDTDGGSLVPTR